MLVRLVKHGAGKKFQRQVVQGKTTRVESFPAFIDLYSEGMGFFFLTVMLVKGIFIEEICALSSLEQILWKYLKNKNRDATLQ